MQLSAQSSPATPPPQANLTADQLVEHLVENAEAYRTMLPSLTAHETILSKASRLIAFQVIHAEATVRVKRETPDGPPVEIRQFTAINGKPPATNKPVILPLTVKGAFGDFPTAFFSREHLPCFTFALAPHPQPYAPLELSISLNPQAAALPQCNPAPAGLTAIARIDQATHQLIHLERTFPPDPDASKARLLFFSIDLVPTRVGQNTFWLPTALAAHGVDGKIRLDWASTYSDYHQFTATSTILPATPE